MTAEYVRADGHVDVDRDRPIVLEGPRPVEDATGSTDTFYVRFGKVVVDKLVSLVLLLAVTPLLLIVAVSVLLVLGRPVLIRQERVGQHGRVFGMYKFRTMHPDRRRPGSAAAYEGTERRRTHKTLSDPRHTPLGRVLRKLSLDELPQLWNVLVGDMSLVGPRPELVDIVRRYQPWQHARHMVRPGLTGLWQTTARGTGLMGEFVHLDTEYIGRISFRFDLKLLLRTIPVLIRPRTF